MRTWILAGLLAVTLMLQQVLAVEAESTFESNQRMAYVALIHACQVTKYNCKGLVVPQVRENVTLGERNFRGLYSGGTILWIDEGMLPIRRQLTIFHETIHYLQFTAGGMNIDMVSRCVLEREAYDLTNLYVDLMGYGDVFKRDLTEWRKSYRCYSNG